MFRNQYDSDVTVWSPQGRLHQVEYAMEAVKLGSATIGLKNKTHAILIALKRASSELSAHQKKIIPIDKHMGISISGLTADARILSRYMRDECLSYKHAHDTTLPVGRLIASLGNKMQTCTQRYDRRPYGVGLLVAGYDDQGPHIYQTCPSANYFDCKVMAIGSRSQSARTYLEKHLNEFLSCDLDELVKHGLRALRDTLPNEVDLSVKRSSVPDSQVSPGYGGSVQMASGHRLAHSYSHPSTISQHPIVNNNFNSGQQVSAAARLSPHSPASILSFSHPQPLSPRVTQGNYGNTAPRLFNVNQVRPQQQVTAQQQLQQQQQRSMPSPGTPASARQSPFPAEAFPPPTSPTASQFPPVPNTGAPNPTTQYRLQRTTSTPSATTQLPGGIGSPRHYGGVSKEQPLLSPSHSHSACPATPTHNATNTQHFSSQQHTPMLYQHTNANTINTPDMQNSQFCYDRSSVPLYPSGGEAQDARSLPPGNPVNHQMGGNSSTSEFVRQELRAIVGARTQQQQQQQQRVPNNLQNNLSGQVSQDDLEALGLTFEMSSAGEAVVSDGPAKSWAIGSAGSAPSSSRTTMEEVARGDPKSSLLQKLLSE